MRVLFVTINERSHLFCMTPLAWALRTAGHDVRVAGNPSMNATITGTGLTAVPVGSDPHRTEVMAGIREQVRAAQDDDAVTWSETDPSRLTMDRMLDLYGPFVWAGLGGYNEAFADDLVAFARSWRPDLVVWDPLACAGAVAAEAIGAAHVRSLWSADVWCNLRTAFLRELERHAPSDREDPLTEWLTGLAARYGVEFSEDLVTGHATIDPLPRSLGLDTGVRRLPMRYVPHNGVAVVPSWLHEPPAAPRVCVTLGASNTETYGADFVSLPGVLGALSDTGVEVVAAVVPAQRSALGEVPGNVRVVESIGLDTLLPTCSAIVHHGGFGTYATALVHGVPQVIVTTAVSDHILRARGLRDRGAGVFLRSNTATAGDVRDAVLAAVAPGSAYRTNAETLRREALAQPTPNQVVAALEELVA